MDASGEYSDVMVMTLLISQVKSSLLYCQFFHMYSTYIQRIEIALLSLYLLNEYIK